MIYILGGNGFVGSAYPRLFNKLNIEYQIINRNNYDQFKNTSCSVLINANGNSNKILAKREPLMDFQANVQTTRMVLEDFKYNFYIHLSTCDVYGDCSDPLMTKENKEIDIKNLSPYGFHKLLGEYCTIHCAKNWLIFRLGGFVGPGLKKNPIFDILNDKPLWLDPKSELQFIHTDDAAAIVWNLYKNTVKNEVFNLCGDGVIKLEQVIEKCSKNLNNLVENSPTVRYEVNIEKIKRYINIPSTQNTLEQFIGEEQKNINCT